MEHKIRQYNDLHTQIRLTKNTDDTDRLHDITPVSGYNGQLPGATKNFTTTNACSTSGNDERQWPQHKDYQCTRTRPLINFKKRKLFQINGLHAIFKKAATPSTIRCGCYEPTVNCALCTGRPDPTHPRSPIENLNRSEKINMIDPAFHPAFSLYEGWYCDLTLIIKEF